MSDLTDALRLEFVSADGEPRPKNEPAGGDVRLSPFGVRNRERAPAVRTDQPGVDRHDRSQLKEEESMAQNKAITLKLTEEQRQQVKAATGNDLSEITLNAAAIGGDLELELKDISGGTQTADRIWSGA